MKTVNRAVRGVVVSTYVGLAVTAGVHALASTGAAGGRAGGWAPATPVQVSACGAITEPGRYVLTRDLEAAAGSNCLEILAPRVDVDLNGHSILGVSSAVGAGIDANAATADDITIRNGSIAGFWIAAVMKSGSVERVRISDVSNGLYLGSGAVVGNTISAERIGVQVHSARVEANRITSQEKGVSCSVSCFATGNVVNGQESGIEVADAHSSADRSTMTR